MAALEAQVSGARGLAAVVTAALRVTLLDLEADDAGSDEECDDGEECDAVGAERAESGPGSDAMSD